MRLIDALKIVNREYIPEAPQQHVFLACGITPLHLETFLTAHLRTLFPNDRITIETGLFDNLKGNLADLDVSTLSSLAVVIEWADLDPRLGFRRLSNWRSSTLVDILESVSETTRQLQQHLTHLARVVPTVVSFPTLPLPPISWNVPYQASTFELNLGQIIANFAVSLGKTSGIRILQESFLAKMSPPGERYDLRSDLKTGFPYTVAHTARLADLLSRLIKNSQPKKGIISDLDGTLWAGILGEDGVDGISWDLEHHTHHHGLYQQLLASLASAGILVAVASKNDASLVERAFKRTDLCLSPREIFPIEAHWSPKSESVQRILQAWNVGPESVVFIDDRPEEVAEVQAAYPQMECIVFPQQDFSELLNLFQHMRELYGKPFLTEEDAIRLNSLSSSRHDQYSAAPNLYDPVIRSQNVAASLTFVRMQDLGNNRGLELLNKTNQFNLNGRLYGEAEWLRILMDQDVTVLLASYQDKFGPLGTIANIVGRVVHNRFIIDAWVMSCRAFARQIEHHCLKYIFETFPVDSIQFDFQATPRNMPLQTFLTCILGALPIPGVILSREDFLNHAPDLTYQMVGDHFSSASESSECTQSH